MAAPAPAPQTTADGWRGRLLVGAAFALPLLLYLATASASVQLDDGAEFVLCARDGSTAHPPGFPAWVTLANAWLLVFGFLPTVTAVCAFVATVSAAGIALLFVAFDAVLARSFTGLEEPATRQWSAFAAALAVATGATVWQWSNSAEVYSLQLFATALVLVGLGRDDGASWWWRGATGVGLGLGLANHHLSTILLLPFLPALLAALRGIAWAAAARSLLPAGGIALVVAGLAYTVMALRAGSETPFAFGQPDTAARLWHHVSGGFFGGSFLRDGVDYAGRAAVLGAVLVRHFWLFAGAFALGAAASWRGSRGVLLLACGYPALYLVVQVARMHTPNMDSTLLPALGVTGLLTALGCAHLAAGRAGRRGMLALVAVALALQVGLNLEACDRRGYAPGTAVLADLDASLPERSVLLLSSWELQTLTLLARVEDEWRPDLVVLAGNLKGTHRDLLQRHYPAFYAAVETEYEAFLATIAAVDPDYVYTDYNTFTTGAQRGAYAALVNKVIAVAKAEKRSVLCDRTTFQGLQASGVLGQRPTGACGMLLTIDSQTLPRPFPLAAGWLEHPFLRHDLCAIGMLHDYRTTARAIGGYWRGFRRDAKMAEPAEAAATRLEAIWTDYLRGAPAPRK